MTEIFIWLYAYMTIWRAVLLRHGWWKNMENIVNRNSGLCSCHVIAVSHNIWCYDIIGTNCIMWQMRQKYFDGGKNQTCFSLRLFNHPITHFRLIILCQCIKQQRFSDPQLDDVSLYLMRNAVVLNNIHAGPWCSTNHAHGNKHIVWTND